MMKFGKLSAEYEIKRPLGRMRKVLEAESKPQR
jgi:hypothetical protein